MNKGDNNKTVDHGPEQALIVMPAKDASPESKAIIEIPETSHDGRCMRIGRDLLDGREEDARAELEDILHPHEKTKQVMTLRFAREVPLEDGRKARMWMSVLINVSEKAKSLDVSRVRKAVSTVGRIVDDLIRDESHTRLRHSDGGHETLKMALSLKATFSQNCPPL